MTASSLLARRWLPEERPRAIVQIAHGLTEHSARYGRLAAALNAAGYAAYANDHRGHGPKTAAADLGHFADEGGWDKVVGDLWTLNRLIATEQTVQGPEIADDLVPSAFVSEMALGRRRSLSHGHDGRWREPRGPAALSTAARRP